MPMDRIHSLVNVVRCKYFNHTKATILPEQLRVFLLLEIIQFKSSNTFEFPLSTVLQ
jgi:hypothetical protein